MRWNKRFEVTKESLRDMSHRPKTIHPNSHTQKELNDIKNLIRRNSNATMIEIYANLKFNKDYKRHPPAQNVVFLSPRSLNTHT